MPLGITGARTGADDAQIAELWKVMRGKAMRYKDFHHGDCIGVDAQAHVIAEELGLRVTIHPPTDSTYRANCRADITLPPKPYRDRNLSIVLAVSHLIVVPSGLEEDQDRSGTWQTYRMAKRMAKPITIIYPGGRLAL